jgi:RND family efflux transporter MFP subunit
MKKIIALIVVILVIVGVIAILMNNKSRSEAQTKRAEALTNFPVTVQTIQKEKIGQTLSLQGTLFPNAEVNLVSETQGRITQLYVNVGSHIGKGGMLAKVDDELKQAAYDKDKATYEKAKWDYETNQNLRAKETINESQLVASRMTYKTAEAQLAISKRQLEDTKVISPISGIITDKKVEEGTVLSNGTPVVTIVDISTLKLKLNVSEKDVFKLKVGQLVEIKSDVYPEVTFNGKIRDINAKGDDSHSYLVEITVANNAKHPLRAGMFARVSFNSIQRDDALVIPREALVGSIRNPQVYVIDNDIVRLRNISIIGDFGSNLEVGSGLSAGERVVVNGQINLKDSAAVSILNK